MKRSHALLVLMAALAAGCASARATPFDEGVQLFREGLYASARDRFDAAVRQAPSDAAGWNNRGVSRMRLGDLDGALADYSRAALLAPADAEIAFNRGNANAAAGNLPAAIADYTSAVSRRPGYAEAYFNRGGVRAVAGDPAGAVADWQWAVDIERNPWTRAVMQQAAGLDDPSAMLAPRRAPGSPAVLDARALVARAMSREVGGDRTGALDDLRAALVSETDAGRRARIDALLRGLEASR